VVRPARLNDVRKLSAFMTKAWREAGPGAMGFAGAAEEAIGEIASEEFLTRRLTSPNVQIVVAETGNEVVGFSSVRRLEAGKAELSGIVVLESAAGKGIGTRLLRKSMEGAKRRGYRTAIVKTETVNDRAIDFYKKAGFVESGKEVEKVGRTKVALQVLVKRLG
jgi:ribosomal protein S18 acetylase RimI-like enzyme